MFISRVKRYMNMTIQPLQNFETGTSYIIRVNTDLFDNTLTEKIGVFCELYVYKGKKSLIDVRIDGLLSRLQKGSKTLLSKWKQLTY